jgi:hypothetical protein
MIGMVKVTEVFFFIARAAEPETCLGGFVGYFGLPLYGRSRRATGRGKYGLAWPSFGYRTLAIGGIVYGSSGGDLKYPELNWLLNVPLPILLVTRVLPA